MEASILCSCGGRIWTHFELFQHLHLPPAPAKAPRPAGDGRRDRHYWRERDRQTKQLARRDGSLFGLSASRVSRVLGKYGKRTDWERIVREEEAHGTGHP